MSSISIVMVSYYTGTSLWLAIDSALAQPECAELIIVNNGNPPGVEALIAQKAANNNRITLITGQGNVGFAKACNLGAKQASGDYLLLLNPDCMLQEGTLARALAGISTYPHNTLAGCFLANPNGSEQRGGRRGLLTPTNAALEMLGLSFLLPPKERLNFNQTQMPDSHHEVPAISGAFMLLARDYYQRLGGMDEAYFLHMEDMDFCYRVQKSGGKIICLPDVKVIHFRSTSEVSSAFVEKQKAKSFKRYLKTHFNDSASKFVNFMMAIAIELRRLVKHFINGVNSIFEPPLYAKYKVARLAVLHHITQFEKREQSLAEKKVLVTGASGQLGLCVVGELLARGAHVVAITQHTRISFEHENLTWVERDLTEKGNPLTGADMEIVIHAAELTMLPRLLPELIEAGAKRVIAFSCIPVLEKVASRYKSDKSRAKDYEQIEQELLDTGKANNCNVTLFRPSAIYGVGLDKGLAKQADIIQRYNKFPLYESGKGLRQPVHVRDVADAAMAVLENPVTYNKIYAIGGAETLTYREMLERIFTYLGKKPRFIRIPALPALLTFLGKAYGLKHVNGDLAYQMNRSVTVDNSLPEQEFGYRPRRFLEGETGL